MALNKIEKLVAKAVLDYSLIAPGDRVLLAVSGGKDSTVLAWALTQRQRWAAPAFHLEAVRMATDLPGAALKDETARFLAELYASWDLAYRVVKVPVIGRLKAGETMNCYWCATQRRTELIRIALDEGFNKIALGHHLEDILSTLLMNMTKKAELATMPPRFSYRKYPLELIRPLVLVDEASISRFALAMGWQFELGACTYAAEGERSEYRLRLERLTDGKLLAKRNLYRSLSCLKSDYLPTPLTKSG